MLMTDLEIEVDYPKWRTRAIWADRHIVSRDAEERRADRSDIVRRTGASSDDLREIKALPHRLHSLQSQLRSDPENAEAREELADELREGEQIWQRIVMAEADAGRQVDLTHHEFEALNAGIPA